MENKVEELKGMILETVKDGVKGIQLEIEKIKEDNVKTAEKVNGLINTPVQKVNLSVPGGEGSRQFIYNGYNLNAQGKNKIVDASFRLVDGQTKDAIAKMLIDMIKSGKQEYIADASLVEGTPGSGGYLVFDEFMNVIRTLGQLSGVMLNEAEVITMNAEKMHYPVDNDKTITTAFKTETTAMADGVPADIVTEIELSASKLGAYAVLTNELINDSKFDIVSFLMQKFAASISRKIDQQAFRVLGTDVLDSLIADASIVDSTGTLNIGHLLDAYSKLDARQAAGAKFYFHRLVHYGTILNMVDTEGNAIFPPNAINTGKSLWDVPVVLVEDLPYTLTGGSTVGLFCNMKQAYVVGQRAGVGSFFINPYSLDLEYETRITLVTRWAGKVGFGKSCVALIY
jgi:HK97 family phage major capsid protein